MRFFAMLLASVFLMLCVACGGSGNSTATPAQDQGRVKITIKWPARDRTIPQATNSITITAVELVPNEEGDGFTEDQQLNVKIVPRPEGDDAISVTVLDLPAIKVRIRAKAFENGLGTGQVIAAGSTDVDVQGAGSTTSANISLSVAVTQITVEPASLTMEPDGDEVLVATGKDADGNTILVQNSDFTWSSTNTSVVIVSQRAAPDGDTADVSALQGGSATVRVTHTPTGVFKDVQVSIPTGVTVSPSGTVAANGGTKQFTATAVGDPSAQFTWSVNGGGTINPTTGLFTAGNISGTFTVTASVVGDPSRVGAATFRVGIPPLLALGFDGTISTNAGTPQTAGVLLQFINGQLVARLFLPGNERQIPIETATEDSFSSDLSVPDFTHRLEGQVTVSGSTATLTMTEETQNIGSGGSLQTATFIGTAGIPP